MVESLRTHDMADQSRNGRLTGLDIFNLDALHALEVVDLAIPTKSFQHVIYYIAQNRGYMEQSGIDLKDSINPARREHPSSDDR